MDKLIHSIQQSDRIYHRQDLSFRRKKTRTRKLSWRRISRMKEGKDIRMLQRCRRNYNDKGNGRRVRFLESRKTGETKKRGINQLSGPKPETKEREVHTSYGNCPIVDDMSDLQSGKIFLAIYLRVKSRLRIIPNNFDMGSLTEP